jgi:hypothetical protein
MRTVTIAFATQLTLLIALLFTIGEAYRNPIIRGYRQHASIEVGGANRHPTMAAAAGKGIDSLVNDIIAKTAYVDDSQTGSTDKGNSAGKPAGFGVTKKSTEPPAASKSSSRAEEKRRYQVLKKIVQKGPSVHKLVGGESETSMPKQKKQAW